MTQAVTSQSQEFVQLYTIAPRDLSFLLPHIPTLEVIEWDPSHRTRMYSLELGAHLVVTKESISRYVYRFLHPGIMLLDEKKGVGCALPKDASLLKAFLSSQNLNQIKKLASDIEQAMDAKTRAELEVKAARGQLGCKVSIAGETEVYFGMKLADFGYFKQSIDYLQEKLTEAESFWDQPDKESLDILLKTHCFLSGGLSYTRNEDWMIIPEEGKGKKGYNFQKLAKKKGLSEEDTKILTELEQSKRVYKRNLYSQEEERVMGLIVFLPAKASEIIPSMESFVRKLKSGYNAMQKLGSINHIRLAAFAHQSITKIHPFEHDNDPFARTVATALLMQGGHNPIFFHNDEEYRKEVRNSTKDLKGFEQYLARCVQEAESLHEDLSLLN